MKFLRTVPVVLVGLAVLVACGETDDQPPAASAPTSAAVSAAPSPSETTADPGGNGEGKSDKERCKAVEAAGQQFKKDLLDMMKAGGAEDPAKYVTVITSFADGISQAGGTGKVGTAADTMAAELKKSATAKDPATAMDNPATTKAATDMEAACKAAGAPITF